MIIGPRFELFLSCRSAALIYDGFSFPLLGLLGLRDWGETGMEIELFVL